MTCTGACNFGDGCNCKPSNFEPPTVEGLAEIMRLSTPAAYGSITRSNPFAGCETVYTGNAWWNSNVLKVEPRDAVESLDEQLD